MRWKVIWTTEAEDQLAEIWLESDDRVEVTHSANELNDQLQFASESRRFESLPEQLWFFDNPPLRAYLEIDLDQQVISVVGIGRPR